jgi:hypothetical protein
MGAEMLYAMKRLKNEMNVTLKKMKDCEQRLNKKIELMESEWD